MDAASPPSLRAYEAPAELGGLYPGDSPWSGGRGGGGGGGGGAHGGAHGGTGLLSLGLGRRNMSTNSLLGGSHSGATLSTAFGRLELGPTPAAPLAAAPSAAERLSTFAGATIHHAGEELHVARQAMTPAPASRDTVNLPSSLTLDDGFAAASAALGDSSSSSFADALPPRPSTAVPDWQPLRSVEPAVGPITPEQQPGYPLDGVLSQPTPYSQPPPQTLDHMLPPQQPLTPQPIPPGMLTASLAGPPPPQQQPHAMGMMPPAPQQQQQQQQLAPQGHLDMQAGVGLEVPPAMSEVYQAAYSAALAAQQQQQLQAMQRQLQMGMGMPYGQFGWMPPAFDAGALQAAAAAAAANAVQMHIAAERELGMDRGVLGGGRGARANGARKPREVQMDAAEFDARYTCIEDCLGQVARLARDQHGCRFLQRKFEEDPETVAACHGEVLADVVELMMDPFGNYLIQKLLDFCSDEQRSEVLAAVGKPRPPESCDADDRGAGLPELVTVALNMHGTRAVQKLIETLCTPEQVSLAVSALQPGVVTLIKDLNGNHVVQRCLQRLTSEDVQFIYDAARDHCADIATHRHGCCVLQRCMDHATDAQRVDLVAEVARQALTLSQDPFGNYVVQYVLKLGVPSACQTLMTRLTGNYAELSMQKFASNVVEKCLKVSDGPLEEERKAIVRELMCSPLLERLLMDPYGNYVVQSALVVSHGQLHNELVDHIRPFLPSIRGSPFGKRILARTNLLGGNGTSKKA